LALVLGACSYIPQRYSSAAEITEALKKLGVGNINVGPFTKTAEFDNKCRVVSGVVEPGKTGFEGYIQNALIEELKVAEMFDDQTPKITLTGVVEKLSLSTLPTVYLSNWDIGVRLNSSNGKTAYINQHYAFNAGPTNLADCQQLADHYMIAVQKTLNKLITSPEFESLVTP
ncbi:MAG: hypothetical protein ABI536_01780, partial [Gallionella sp.]